MVYVGGTSSSLGCVRGEPESSDSVNERVLPGTESVLPFPGDVSVTYLVLRLPVGRGSGRVVRSSVLVEEKERERLRSNAKTA